MTRGSFTSRPLILRDFTGMNDWRREWYPTDWTQKHGPSLPQHHGTVRGKSLPKTPWKMVNKQLLLFGKPSLQKVSEPEGSKGFCSTKYYPSVKFNPPQKL